MEIPDNAFWGGLGVMVSWLLTMERRMAARPTRQEQEATAAKVAAGVKEDFAEIKRMLEKQNESATRDRQSTLEHRQWVGDSLADIRTRVAVLRDRAGDDPLNETGAHRRRL